MRIALVMFSQHENILHLKSTLEAMEHEVTVIETDDYHLRCSYLAKKLDKAGFHGARKKFNKAKVSELEALSKTADRVLFINTPENVIGADEFKRLKEKFAKGAVPFVLWIVDVVRGKDEKAREYFPLFDKIFAFEKQDIKYLKEAYGIEATYCPVGYNKDYISSAGNFDGDYDISFVGMPYKNRMKLLDKLAKAAQKNGWRLGVFGPFYDNKLYFWKRLQRERKYPQLFKYVHDGRLSPAEVAALYRQSKICLNIHVEHAKGMNPRTFEIMAAGAFELIDERDFYDSVVPGEHLDTFSDADELIKKCEYYLTHNDEREKIAAAGKRLAKEKYRIEQSLEFILE